MADDCCLDRAWRWLSVLYVSDRSRRYQDQHEYDQNRQYCPGKFYLVTTVDLRRLAGFISCTMSKANDGIKEQARNHDENDGADYEHQYRSLFDLLSWLRQGTEDVSDTIASECGFDMPA